MKMKRISVLCGILMFMAGAVWAADGTITSISVTPASPKVNESIHVTVQGTGPVPGKKCQIVLVLGDGSPMTQKGVISSFPYTFDTHYDKSGTFTMLVFSGANLYGTCTGEAQAVVKVKAKLDAGVAKKVLKADPCPPGWHKKSYDPVYDAFTCVPNMPRPKIQYPPHTLYFETECTVGCQAIPY